MFKASLPTITNNILELVAKIDSFKGEWRGTKLLSPETLKLMQNTASIESIGSSTRIEGVTLSDQEIEKLLANLKIQKFETRDEQEVVGYAEALELIYSSFGELKITENHIKQLHKVLLKFSEKDARHRGEYKKNTNSVSAFDEQGKLIGVIFETETPFNTPEAMRQLVTWANTRLDNQDLHPLLLTGVFIIIFLAIHPFQDGNGRMARLLTTLLLLRAGYDYAKYSSLERIVEENKDLYYAALRKTQKTLNSTAPDYEPWLVFFLQALATQTKRLQAKIKSELKTISELNSDGLNIINLFESKERLTLAEIVSLTGKNRNTLKVRLQELTKKGMLKRRGKGRGTFYTRF